MTEKATGQKPEQELSNEEHAKTIPVYIQRKDCTEEEINALIRLGYTPWQITPVMEEVRKNGITTFSKTVLMYHLIRRRQ